MTARACVGRPFSHQGRRPEQGFDCVGLILYVAGEQGVGGFDRLDYGKIPVRDAISRHAAAAGFHRHPLADMKPGDALILKISRRLEHAAILSDRGVIHACEKYGRVVEHRLDEAWRRRIMAAYAFPGLS